MGKIHEMGWRRWFYENEGGCCTVISERTDGNGVKIITLCGAPIDQTAFSAGLPGSGVTCRQHLDEKFAQSGGVAAAIERQREHTRKTLAGEYRCDVCGRPGARHCPGEGQYLCNRCNTRSGINRWS